MSNQFSTKDTKSIQGRRGSDYMVVGFTNTWCGELESRSGRGVQHNMIKFVSDLRQVGGFLWVLHQ